MLLDFRAFVLVAFAFEHLWGIFQLKAVRFRRIDHKIFKAFHSFAG